MEKRKKIFEDDGVMVESVEVEKKEEPVVPMRRAAARYVPTEKTLKVSDVLNAFAGFLPSQASFLNPNSKPGECAICGKPTTNVLRTICFDCLKAHSAKIHDEAIEAINNGKTEFSINL